MYEYNIKTPILDPRVFNSILLGDFDPFQTPIPILVPYLIPKRFPSNKRSYLKNAIHKQSPIN